MRKIERYRKNTAPDAFQLKVSGAGVNINGYGFLMTISKEKDPTDTGEQLYQLIGTIDSISEGKFSFAPSPVQADQELGDYFWDIEVTDSAGKTRTLEKGKYKYLQPITQ